MVRGLLSIIIILFYCGLCSAAEIEMVIKEDESGDYTSLEACLGANEQDLTDGAGDTFIAKIDGTWDDPDTTYAELDGWTCDVDNFVTIYTTAAARHEGVASSDRYRLDPSGDTHCLRIDEFYTVVEGLELTGMSGSSSEGIRLDGDGDYSEIGYCLIHTDSSTNNQGDGIYAVGLNAKIYNCIIYDMERSGIHSAIGGNYAYNCSVINCGNATYPYGGYYSGYGTFTCYNCVACDCNDLDFKANSGHTITGDYNFSKDDSAPGANSIHGTTDGKTVDFVNTSGGTEDLHLQSTSDAIGVGTDDPSGGLYDDDIDGDTRSSTWDIGADEYVGVSTTTTTAPAQIILIHEDWD